jgi:hypothetical protein
MDVIGNFRITNKQEQRNFIRGQKFPREKYAALYILTDSKELLGMLWLQGLETTSLARATCRFLRIKTSN